MNEYSITEIALGCFLHDIGKLLQRAGGSRKNLPAAVQSRASDILPSSKGRHTHLHAPWTELFFEEHSRCFPDSVNAARVRNVAVYKPASFESELCATADRLASGMDRKEKDIEQELGLEQPAAWDRFIKTPLQSCFCGIRLPEKKPSGIRYIGLNPLLPDSDLTPIERPDVTQNQERYKALWAGMKAGLDGLAEANLSTEAFCENLSALSERYLTTVPSSTMDQPDISLHDHARATAAVGAALYAFHASDGTLEDRDAIRRTGTLKFRWIVGDLSGIQSSLFRLASEGVRGVNKILRARSFLFTALLDGTLLELQRTLNLPRFCVVQNAGGRFLMLAPNIAPVERGIREVRESLESWLWPRYSGELAINLTASAPFRGSDFDCEHFSRTMGLARSAAAEAKLRPFSSILDPIHRHDYAQGVCSACAVRPGREQREDRGLRCRACADEEKIGGQLPKAAFFGWTRTLNRGEDSIPLFRGWHFVWDSNLPTDLRRFASVYRLDTDSKKPSPVATRFIANYVPRLSPQEVGQRAYRFLRTDEPLDPGDLKTFEHLAADALEPDPEDPSDLIGEPLLAVLKADVDRLGFIFAGGISDPTLGRVAAVSRFLDFFFSGRLMYILRERFPSTYTVYAGGDDLLLIGPWLQMLQLAEAIRQEFDRWTGSNPSVTISAAIEFMKVNHPLNRVVLGVEERLAEAKHAGRDRISAIDDQAFPWDEFHIQMASAERLTALLRNGALSQAFVYSILRFADERDRAEGRHQKALDLGAANWRARWGYQLARQLKPDGPNLPAIEFLNSLLGLTKELHKIAQPPPSPKLAVSTALYRNRSGKERRND